MRVWIFCDGSSKDEAVKQTGREKHIAGVTIRRWERLVAAKQAQGSH